MKKELTLEIFRILNESSTLYDSMQRIVDAIKKDTGFDAIGIRLQNGEDFPYYSQNGFSADFIATENMLVCSDTTREPCRNKNGQARLECTCGLVLLNTADPAQPPLTIGGSYWTNNAPSLLNIPPNEEIRINPRNTCVHKGYRSVALVPIKNKDKVIGLIQFNDHQENCFSLELIESFENIALYVGEAMMLKQSEDNLKQLSLRLEKLTEVAPGMIYQFVRRPDGSFFIPFTNNIVSEMFGCLPADVLEDFSPIVKVILPEDLDRVIDSINYSAENLSVWSCKYRVQIPGQPVKWFLGNSMPSRSEDGTIVWHGFNVDISENVKTDEATQLINNRFVFMIENSYDVIWHIDSNLCFNYISPSDKRMRGFERDEVMGTSIFKILKPEGVEEVKKVIQKRLDGHHNMNQLDVIHYELEVICKNGSYIWTEQSVTPLYDTNDKLIGYFGISRDTTEKKQITQNLEIAKKKAENASDSKSRFLSNMSHELRNPLNGIQGLIQELLDDDLNPKQRNLLTLMFSSCQSLTQIVNDVLDFSKIEANRVTIINKPFDLRKLASEINALLIPLMMKKNVAMKINYNVKDIKGNNINVISGDEMHIRQIILNLYGNAIKFTEEGSIFFDISGQETATGCINCCIAITDTGIGISPDDQEKIFDRFSQADSAMTKQYQGTGLGLTISRSLAGLMGGKLSVQSKFGQGSTFSLELPLQKASYQLPTNSFIGQANYEEKIHFSHRSILCADDDSLNLMLMENVFERVGYTVDKAKNGQEIMNKVQYATDNNFEFDVILTDVSMPVMSGIDALSKLRGQGYSGAIILLTGHAFKEDRENFLVMGATDVLTKPCDRGDMVSMVNKYVALKQQIK